MPTGERKRFLLLIRLSLAAALVAAPLSLAQAAQGSKNDGGGGGGEGGEDDGGGPDDGGPDDHDSRADDKRKGAERKEEQKEIRIIPSPIEGLETPCVLEKNAEACLAAGLAWKAGIASWKGGKPDLIRADNFLRTGCYLQNGEACVLAGRMHLAMEAGFYLRPDGIVSLDYGTAVDLFDKGCTWGNVTACGLGGDLYFAPESLLPKEGAVFHDIERDEIAAKQFWERGCHEKYVAGGPGAAALGKYERPPVDPRSCLRLAELYASGYTVLEDAPRAAAYAQLACDVGEVDEHCDRAEVMRERADEAAITGADDATHRRRQREIDGEEEFVQETSGRGTGALAPSKPKTGRFDDPDRGVIGQRESSVRFELEFKLGARWIYGPAGRVLFGFGGGIDLWFNMFGIGLDVGYSTNDLLQQEAREYSRFQVALVAKAGIPLPIRLSIPARLIVVPAIGGHIGTRALVGGSAVLQGGLEERIELRISSPQRRGPRQWGAVRFSQTQSWVRYTFGAVEHSSKVMVVLGFTFGGTGPEFPKKPAPDRGDE